MTSAPPAQKPRLLFISPQFLFPMDAGGKIRTANILKNMKGGAFQIELLLPATPKDAEKWATELQELCDHYTLWEPGDGQKPTTRALNLLHRLPVSVAGDATPSARLAVAEAIAREPELIVFDYVHAMALAPTNLQIPHIFFAHNVEAEIFKRHAEKAKWPMKPIWASQAKKMARFEQAATKSVDGVIAVSDRDAEFFNQSFGAKWSESIPTGVDHEFFCFKSIGATQTPRVTFTGSMDWAANQDGLVWFMEDVWPQVLKTVPDAEFIAVGKNPPEHLVQRAKNANLNWQFTGFVDDVRDHARGNVFVIPLRIGGGTRIKAFEAMAMGVPIVSTSLGIEGLPVISGTHYINADTASAFADAVSSLLQSPEQQSALAKAARDLVEKNYGQDIAARKFEMHCRKVLTQHPKP